MAQLNPFIRFNDMKCREAMNFYKSCLGGELEFMTVKGSPMAKDMPEDKQELIMHSTLKKGEWMIVGSDMMRDIAKIGDHVGISLNCESEEEIKDIFSKLSVGGEVFMELQDVFWGATFGLVTDKYGVEWMLNFQKKQMKPDPRLHHYCQNINRGYLKDIVEMYDLLNLKVVYTPPTKDWIMVGQEQLRFAIQITQVDSQPIEDIEIKKRTHIAFLSDDPQKAIELIENWTKTKNIKFRQGGWSSIERYFDLPEIFNNFVVEIMHTSIEKE